MDCSPPGSSVHSIPRQKYWSGVPFPSPGDLSDPGIKPVSPVLADESLMSSMALDIHQLKMRMWGGVLSCLKQDAVRNTAEALGSSHLKFTELEAVEASHVPMGHLCIKEDREEGLWKD